MAKRLRRIARGLKLPGENSYAPVGREEYVEARKDHGRQYSAGIKRRPVALTACERRAYQEAKALYRGQSAEIVEPVYHVVLEDENIPARTFADKMVNSIKKQPEGPSA